MSLSVPTEQELREELGSPTVGDISTALLTRIISEEGSLYPSLLRASRILTRKFAQQANIQVGRYKEDFLERAKFYKELAQEVEAQMGVYGALPYVGGISTSDKSLRVSDPDRPDPSFQRDMLEDNWT